MANAQDSAASLISVSAKATGLGAIQKSISDMAKRSADPAQFLAHVGHRLALTQIPLSVRRNEMKAPKPRMRAGQPLRDTGRLISSLAYRVQKTNLTVGTGVLYGGILNRGGTIKPVHGQWLLIPLSPPLTSTQARAFPQGKQAIRSAYPGSRFLALKKKGGGTKKRKASNGYEGPGIYRPRGDGKIQRIAIAVRAVKIDARWWLIWRPGWPEQIAREAAKWILNPKLFPGKPMTGGTLDSGKKA